MVFGSWPDPGEKILRGYWLLVIGSWQGKAKIDGGTNQRPAPATARVSDWSLSLFLANRQ